jgi:hypothetical protein
MAQAKPEAEKREAGFEYDGRFYPWHISTKGKDLQIVDRVSDMPISEFFGRLDDPVERERVPIVLALMGTSLRHGNPAWSISRIVRLLEDIDLDEVQFSGDEGSDEDEEADPGPPVVDAVAT